MLSCDKLRALRLRQHLTQKELARRMGITKRYVQMIERGDRNMAEDTYKKWLNSCYGVLCEPKEEA